MVQQIVRDRLRIPRTPTQRREQTARSEDLSGELQGEREGPQPTKSKDDAEARKDFWSIQGDFVCRHHNEPRVQLHVPKEETIPIPLKCIDVTWCTHTDLDVMREKKTITGMSIHASLCQTPGQDSQNLLY